MGNRCSGDCCRGFNFSGKTFDDLRALAQEGNQQAIVWLPLLVSMGFHSSNPKGKDAIVGWSPRERDVWPDGTSPESWEYFECNALQPNGDCGVYGTDARPECCALFPYNNEPCGYSACTWDEGRSPLIAVHRLTTRRSADGTELAGEPRAADAVADQ